ncbi:MAG: sporulation integral membrane protein YtvI [Oscillospiraceae bacterium]|nr:sporulation integral membrane protein YtvI [Oscillospiraceae bacterium]
MYREKVIRIGIFAAGFLSLWLFLNYLLPIFLPFFLGFLLALASEPAVRLGVRWKLPRWVATGLGVTLTLILLVTLAGILGAVVVKELGILAGRLPNLQDTAQQAAGKLRTVLENVARHSPEGIRPVVDKSVSRLLSSDHLMEQATFRLPQAISGFLSRIPDGALGIGTGILSGFMLSVRLPVLRETFSRKLPENVRTTLLPSLKRAKNALFGWLKAQLKLCGITFCIVTAGLLVMGVPYAPLWAVIIAFVDAVPLLGTGTILLPWALVSLLQKQHFRAIGLICTYGAAVITRTVSEPRLMGRHLGLDPLITLIFLYLGYRFWGIWGMLLAPLTAAVFTAAGQELPIKKGAP